MTNNFHTPIPSSPRQPANGATINAPLGELDAELTAQDARLDQLEANLPVPSGAADEFYNGLGGWTVPAGTGSTNGHVIQDEGVDLPQRTKLNFLGTGVNVTDDPAGTKVTITAGGVEDHGALTGLADDDHPQYHNNARGDARYDARYPRKYAGKSAAPTANDDSGDGYVVGDRWLDETHDKEYVVLDVTPGAAVWIETTITDVGAKFWQAIPGSPVRASNTTFTTTGDYSAGYPFGKGVVFKWTESGVVKCAMQSIPQAYSAPNTTFTFIGDTMASIDVGSLKYALIEVEKFIISRPGSLGAVETNAFTPFTNMAGPRRFLGADPYVDSAGVTNNTTFDINLNGTSVFTTKPTLASTVQYAPTPFSADNGISIAFGGKVTADIDAVQTTPAIDGFIMLYLFPTHYLYMT